MDLLLEGLALGFIMGGLIGLICGDKLGFEKACRIHDKDKDNHV